ncbi:hypothetical protein FBUS_00824 [Fasciolopsis buskii]|uniref:Uncharacterized protein n=1 Tax=Fasciolopsis buskii TaxID=27845 RepID=A0A8E0VEJ2_9TREM|nr:hypothetical protein FBUS_00824 [Fasciolopsis buski]
MVFIARITVVIGLLGLLHAAYSATQHRSYLRLTEQESDSLPIDIVFQTIVSFGIACIGLIGASGSFKEIEASAEFRDKILELVDSMVSQVLSLGRGHTDSVTSLSLGDRLLSSGGEDGEIYFWAPNQLSYPVQSTARMEPCAALKFNPNKSEILYSAHGGRILSWDFRQLSSPVSEWNVNEDEINSLDVLPNEPFLCAADDTGAVQVLDINTGCVARTLKKHDNICSVARFRPNRAWQLISGGLDCRMIVSDWKGTGLGVIIFELDEIVDSSLFSDYHSGANEPPPGNVNQGSSDSHASTSEFAEVEYDDLAGTDDDDGAEFADQPRSEVEDHSRRASEGRAISSYEEDADQTRNISGLGSDSQTEEEESTSQQVTAYPAQNAWSAGLPINPPMVHCIDCSPSGDFAAAGLEKSTVELFAGDGKRLNHVESLYGHRRAVSALHFISDSFLLSGGNDYSLFLWNLGTDIEGQHIAHDAKINAIEGKELGRIFVADFTPVIRVFDLSARGL